MHPAPSLPELHEMQREQNHGTQQSNVYESADDLGHGTHAPEEEQNE